MPVQMQEIEAPEQQPPIAIMRILQRRLNLQPEAMANEIETERDVKLTILGVLKDVVDETYKKLTTKEQDIPA